MRTLIINVIVVCVILMIAAKSYADILRFVWDYATEDQAIIAGFKLYEDGVAIQTVPPDARTVDTPYIEDRQARIYYLTAFSANEESVPSDAVTIPAFIKGIKRIATGSFTVEIIEE